MSRLYDSKILNENIWKVEEIDNKNYHTYKLINKEKNEEYYFNNIIGFEQVTEDEFLVYKVGSGDYFRIDRVKLNNSKITSSYMKQFTRFEFITDDYIMYDYYDNHTHYRCDGVYSISQNKEIEEAKWLNMKSVEIYTDEKTNEKIVYLEDSIYLYGNTYSLMFTVDPNTFRPNSKCYSSLRNKYIDIQTKEDYEKIKSEDNYYACIIGDILLQKEFEERIKAKEKILNRNA